MIKAFISACTLLITLTFHGQDTFSIVAVDRTTGEVGSAAASCVDLFSTSYTTEDFLSELFPGKGAINTQAYYDTQNQSLARERMQAGDSPQKILAYLNKHDIIGSPQMRQYGIVAFVNNKPLSAAYTGKETEDFHGHLTGKGYAIQGNILSGNDVLRDMEKAFLKTEGDLAHKLMAALQGAKRAGADSRCTENGTSSLFAFIKVAQPTDEFGHPSFKLSVRTKPGSGKDPIDLLQQKFDKAVAPKIEEVIPPAPVGQKLITNSTHAQIKVNSEEHSILINVEEIELPTGVEIMDKLGRVHFSHTMRHPTEKLDVTNLEDGSYFLVIKYRDGSTQTQRFFHKITQE